MQYLVYNKNTFEEIAKHAPGFLSKEIPNLNATDFFFQFMKEMC